MLAVVNIKWAVLHKVKTLQRMRAAQYFNISIFQFFNISISISLPHSMRVPSSLGKRARGQPFIVIWPSGEYVAGYVERVKSMVSPG